MIYTFTANPAIDINFSSNTFDPALANRTFDTVYSPNGKGVNVSLVLDYFNIKSIVLGFFGGFSGKYIIETLNEKGLQTNPIWINDFTRINVFIHNKDKEYKFVNKGPNVSKQQQQMLIDILKQSNNCSLLIISGSLPNGIDESFYDDILKTCKLKNIDFVLDISSKKLKDLLKYKPKLIKPNDEEIKEIFNLDIKNDKDAIFVLKYLYNEGAKNILLTLGNKGLYFYNGLKIFYCSSAKVKLLSSACAGDACLATFLSKWLLDEKNIENALKNASAIGADVASSSGLGNFEKYNDLIKEIYVKEIIV